MLKDTKTKCMNDISGVFCKHTGNNDPTSLPLYAYSTGTKNGAKILPKPDERKEKISVRTKTVHRNNKDIVHCRHYCQMLSTYRFYSKFIFYMYDAP